MSITPLISSGTAGPLGILHLPRLWLKTSLAAAGKLNPDYPAIGGGYDSMVLSALGIDKAVFSDFIASKKPTYPELEAWVVEQNGGPIAPETISKLNDSIVGYNHDDETRKEILSASGIPDDGKILDAIHLNNLDDWATVHKNVIVG